MKKITIALAVVFLLGAVLTSCGTSRSSCNTKGKTRVDMGWM